MRKNIIVSNRLPVQVTKSKNNYIFRPSSGGLATGLSSVHTKKDSLWIGWAGIAYDDISDKQNINIEKSLSKLNLSQVKLSSSEINEFYFGMSNKCIWPLFHYFIEYSKFDNNNWKSYEKINKKFCDRIIENIDFGGTVWVHDYQLLLLPKMIKDLRPDITIGFFLHIPFPSFEIFRIFPWRIDLLKGMLGADLIGFHTFDYQRHFLSSVKRILRYDVSYNKVRLASRQITVNTFPMGIDYKKFFNAAKAHKNQNKPQKSQFKKQLEIHKKSSKDSKLILSIDRLDYTKGIINRIKAFEVFLKKYPQYLEKVRLLMLTVPSRSNVPQYKRLKKDTDELVGRLNSKYATVNWTPIWYYYREMEFEDLIDLYMSSDIAMITPVRDGMNLVAKEFVATRVNQDGVLILSEMAGASKELFDALTVNPFDLNSMADSIFESINMPLEEQKRRNLTMQKRLSRHDVEFWAKRFFDELQIKSRKKNKLSVSKIEKSELIKIKKKFKKSKKKIFLLDYDGTLVNYHHEPESAIPTKKLLDVLRKLIEINNTQVSIISGRNKEFLEKWFGKMKITLFAEHGHFKKEPNSEWIQKNFTENKWKKNFLPIFNDFSDRTPGTFVEEKNSCLVWHYRKTDPELAIDRVVELKTIIKSMISQNLSMFDGNKTIEILNSEVNKGTAVNEIIGKDDFDFVFCAGDDVSDEYMFKNLPADSISVMVGVKNKNAKFFMENSLEMIGFLEEITRDYSNLT